MRYYYEPKEQQKKWEIQEKCHEMQKQSRTHDSLVIEDDTVYEVDEACKRRLEMQR